MAFTVKEFENGYLPAGMMSFPFTFQIPDWLPASMQLCDENWEKSMISTRYILRAQVTPLEESDWGNEKQTISSFHGDTNLLVFKPTVQTPEVNLARSIVSYAGGFCCCFNSPSTTKILLEKDQFYPGEEVRLRLVCDNSQCSADVLHFKVMMTRNFKAETK